MRTPLFAAALSLALFGCLSGSVDEGTGDDDNETPGGQNPGGENPGGQNPGGNGGVTPTPKLNATLDRVTVASELGKDEVVTVNLASVDGFTGDVAVTATLVDSTGTPIPGVTVTGTPSVNVGAGATAADAFTVKIPSNATGADLAATLKVDVSSSVGAVSLTSAVTIAAVFNVNYAAGLGGTVANHPDRGLQITVKAGTKIRYHNSDTAVHITHGDGVFPHETTGATGGLANGTYEVVAKVGNGNLGCHSHGNATYAKFTVVQ